MMQSLVCKLRNVRQPLNIPWSADEIPAKITTLAIKRVEIKKINYSEMEGARWYEFQNRAVGSRE